jgi:hypothetical protein
MNQILPASQKKQKYNNDNLVESVKSSDRLPGYPDINLDIFGNRTEIKPQNKKKQEFSLFNYQQHYENEIIKKQIRDLTEAVRKEIELIKKTDRSLLSQISDIEKISLESLPSPVGIYHVRFLEIVLNILRALRSKISESRTWLQALISKKKKRGSLFAVLSKKKGTQYSLSQELSSARSIQ